MATYKAPNGADIIGTIEVLSGYAELTGIDPETGEPEYSGTTEIYWDAQETLLRDGQIVFVDDGGDEWFFNQLIRDDLDDHIQD